MEIRNRTIHGAPMDPTGHVFWSLFGIDLAVPWIVFSLILIFGSRAQDAFAIAGRYRHYGIRSLQRSFSPSLIPCYLLIYRHRPLLMELVKVVTELFMFLGLLGAMADLKPVVLWCTYDILAAAHAFNSLELIRHTDVPASVSLNFHIYLTYSLFMGFPLGFVVKILWLHWVTDRINFLFVLMPCYIGAICGAAYATLYLLPKMVYSCFKGRNDENNRVSVGNVLMTAFLLLHFIFWFIIFCNVQVCHTPHSDLMTLMERYMPSFHWPCGPYTAYWSTALLPITIELTLVLIILVALVVTKGMLWRFLAEIVSLWSLLLTFSTCMFYVDMENSMILYAACLALCVSMTITIFVNLTLLRTLAATIRIMSSRRHLRALAMVQMQMNTEEERNKITRTRTRILNTAKKAKKQRLAGTLARNIGQRIKFTNCCICWDTYSQSSTNAEEDGVMLAVIKVCGHYFHYDCAWTWLEKKASCPLCRQNVPLTKHGIQAVSWKDIRTVAEGGSNSQRSSTSRDDTAESSVSSSSSASTISDVATPVPSPSNSEQLEVDMDEASTSGACVNVLSCRPASEIAETVLPVTSSMAHADSMTELPFMSQDSLDFQFHDTRARELPVVFPVHDAQHTHSTRRFNSLPKRWIPRSVHIATPGLAGLYTVESLTQFKDNGGPHMTTTAATMQPTFKSKTLTRASGSNVSTLGRYQPSRRPLVQLSISNDQRRRCQLCRRRFEGDPCDVVVGYLRSCGHFFHCLCIDMHINSRGQCPVCPSNQRPVDVSQIQLSLLSDVLSDLETQELFDI